MSEPAYPTITGLHLQPLLHVTQMAQTVTFFERLGGRVIRGDHDGDWVLMIVGSVELALVLDPTGARVGTGCVELDCEFDGDLDDLAVRLDVLGVSLTSPISDEPFGRRLELATPDGLPIGVNEITDR